MLLRFCKMHCLGDDLLLIELLSQHAYIQAQHVRQWASAEQAIGFQRLLLIDVPGQPDVDFSCRIYDIEAVEQDCRFTDLCAVARLLLEQRITNKNELRLQTRNGIQTLRVTNDGWVSMVYPQALYKTSADLPDELTARLQEVRVSPGQLHELAGDELYFSLDANRQQVTLHGLASYIFEGQVSV